MAYKIEPTDERVSETEVVPVNDPPGCVTVLEGATVPAVIGHPFGIGVNQIQLPIQPLYDMKLAADLIPCTYTALCKFLSNHRKEFLARYRIDTNRRRIRLLSATEIVYVRSKLLRGPGKTHYDPVNT